MYLKKASQLLLKEAKENPEGSAYKYMTSMLTSAFFLEAYLNHLGRKIIDQYQWDKWERKSSFHKLKTLVDKINYLRDETSRPFKTFQEIFEFRNLLVHGKTAEYTVNGVQKVDVEVPISKQINEAEWKSQRMYNIGYIAIQSPDTSKYIIFSTILDEDDKTPLEALITFVTYTLEFLPQK